MSLDIFNKRYKACSNLFVKTIENKDYIFPSPLHIYATIEDENKNTRNLIEFKFDSFYDSILILNGYFDIFLCLLDFEYKITTLYIESIINTSTSSEGYGYKGSYLFSNENLVLNITEKDFYNDFTKK